MISKRTDEFWCLIAAVFLVLSGLTCSESDPEEPGPPPPPPTGYQNLTQKDHVLNNLELAYNERSFTRYAELLDDPNFVYFFSDEDYAVGRTPEQWGRAEDLDSHQRMFNPNNPVHKVLSIKLTLEYPAGQWVETTPDQGQFPGETWYYKEVTYNLTVVVEAQPQNITYLAQNLKALFTVRRIEKNGKQIWQIVEWRDDVDLAARSSGQSTAGPPRITWGQIKGAYGG